MLTFPILDANNQGNFDSSLYSLIFMIILIAVFWLLLIRPQRKKEKQDAEMRKNIQIGDEVVTAGGIVGIVCKVEEQTVVIETTGDRSKFRIQKWAISQNITAIENQKASAAAVAAAKKAKAEEDQKAKEEKSKGKAKKDKEPKADK